VAYETALQIISAAAVECSLGEVTDAYGSSDNNIVLMRQLLKDVGRALVKSRTWTQLVKEGSITTVEGTYLYDLPADFRSLVDQTLWNRTTQLPVPGPISPQGWQLLRGRVAALAVGVFFRIQSGKVELYPVTDTPGDQELYYEYNSSYWVTSTSATSPDKESPTANDDTLYFDPLLLTQLLRLAFLRNRGLPSETAEEDVRTIMPLVVGDDAPATILSLVGGRAAVPERMVGARNLPDAGFGS
jgi:hypothetical protein